MSETGTILLVEDDVPRLDQWRGLFEKAGWKVHPYSSAREAREALPQLLSKLDLAILDHKLPPGKETGLELGVFIKEDSKDIVSVVLLTAYSENAQLRNQVKYSGIDDLWGKTEEFHAEILPKAKEQFLQSRQRRRSMGSVGNPNRLSPEERDAYIAKSLMPVLIIGDSGTGKELTASEIHDKSGLPPGNYRPVNCAAFTDTLLMSELFGHVRGSFTGADQNRLGLILEAAGVRTQESDKTLREYVEEVLSELWQKSQMTTRDLVRDLSSKDPKNFYGRVIRVAKKIADIEKATLSLSFVKWLERCGNKVEENEAKTAYEFVDLGKETGGINGTIFLDEVGDLKPDAQAALLRFLDGNGIRPVGYSGLPLKPKVRIITATNRSISDVLRPDFLWRLAGWIIYLQPLHRRNLQKVLDVAQKRADGFGTGHDRPQDVRGTRFKLNGDALRCLQEMILGEQFSGKTSLFSGNFRHLLWLIDRACWIAAIEKKTDIVDEATLMQAESMVVMLEQGGEEIDGPSRLIADPLLTVASSAQGMQQAPALSSDALKGILVDFAELHNSSEWHPADYSSVQATELDERLVKALSDFLSDQSFVRYPDRSLKHWQEEPHSALKVETPLQSVVRPRWCCLLCLAIIAACGRIEKKGLFRWNTVTKIFDRPDPQAFRDWVKEVFVPFGITITITGGAHTKPLEDIVTWLISGTTELPTIKVAYSASRGQTAFEHMKDNLVSKLGLRSGASET